MSASSLPVDPAKEGNVWCEACRQSLTAARAGAHLASKKHAEKLELAKADALPTRGAASIGGERPKREKKERAAEKAEKEEKAAERPAPKGRGKKAPESSEEESDEPRLRRAAKAPARDEGEKARAAPEKAAPAGAGLPRDPNKEGNYWCGICGVSLSPSKAAAHLETTRHASNAKKTLSAATHKLRSGDD
jgi:hypothetical protein